MHTPLLIPTECPCKSGKTYQTCCGPYHQGLKWPETAEKLMRSRYSAYVKVQVSWLIDSVHSSTRANHNPLAIQKWAKKVAWLNLEILRTERGMENDEEGFVEFRAWYVEKGKPLCLQEYSRFLKEEGQWRYVDGEFPANTPKIGRNDPCPCGSGKKFKKCHG